MIMDPTQQPTIEVKVCHEVFNDEHFQDDNGKICKALITYIFYWYNGEKRIVEYSYKVDNDPHMTEDSMEESVHDAIRFHAGFNNVYFECKKGNAITPQ